jgi:hypothetical protein
MERPENEVDTRQWTGPEDLRKRPDARFGLGEAAAFIGILLFLLGALGAIFNGIQLGTVVMIVAGVCFFLIGLPRLNIRS